MQKISRLAALSAPLLALVLSACGIEGDEALEDEAAAVEHAAEPPCVAAVGDEAGLYPPIPCPPEYLSAADSEPDPPSPCLTARGDGNGSAHILLPCPPPTPRVAPPSPSGDSPCRTGPGDTHGSAHITSLPCPPPSPSDR